MSKYGVLNTLLKANDWLAVDVLLRERPDLLTAKNSAGKTILDFACEDSRWSGVLKLAEHGASGEFVIKGLFSNSELPVDILVKTIAETKTNFEGGLAEDCLSHAYKNNRLDLVDFVTSRLPAGSVYSSKVWVEMAAFLSQEAMYHLSRSEVIILPSKGEMKEIAGQSVVRRNQDLLILLSVIGLDLDAELNSGLTLISFASKMRNLVAVEFLCIKGAKVDAMGSDGHSALYHAVSNGDSSMVELLLNHNASPELRQGRNRQGNSPMRLAAIAKRAGSRVKLVPVLEEAVFKRLIDSAVKPANIKVRL